MQRFSEFSAERQAVRTVEEWRAFCAKWFDLSAWPCKTSAQLASESLRKRGPIRLGGRQWSYTSWGIDLTPEARYEYCWTLHAVGDPLAFPHMKNRPTPPPGESWAQECPYCEISTDQIGEEVCPQCSRGLVYVYVSD